MSYILDALRKADFEREQGGIPGLHAQPAYPDPMDLRARPWWGHPGIWIGVGLCAGLLAASGAIWLFLSAAPTAAPAPALPPVAMARPTASVALPLSASSNALPNAAPGLPGASNDAPLTSASQLLLASRPIQGSGTELQKDAQSPNPVLAQPFFNAPPLEPTEPPAKRSAATTAPTSPPQPDLGEQAQGRIHQLAELPRDVRAKLPNLSIGGSSYSETPSSRLLILDGQVYREGDKIAKDHVLETIELKSVVLRFRGYRYVINY